MVQTAQARSTTSQIKQKQAHLDEWIQGSAVSETITRLNLKSLDNPQEIAQRLNWKKYKGTSGWWVSGINPLTGKRRHFGQFKPDTPIKFLDRDKPAKYITGPKTLPSEAIFLDTGDCDYWKRLLKDPSELLVITEGTKKSGSGLTAGLATIALTGVWNGQHKKTALVENLQPFAVHGRPICLCFDADLVVKPEVQQALVFLGNLLKKAGCLVTVAQLPIETKGLDDYVVLNGRDAFRELVGNAVAYEEWLKGLEIQVQSFSESKRLKRPDKPEPPQPSIVARELAERYYERLRWNDEAQLWFRYEAEQTGIWTAESDIAVESAITAELDADGRLCEGYTLNFLRSVSGILKRKLIAKHWDEQPGLLPMQNGVLRLSTGKLEPHTPGFRLTWCLPYNFNSSATCAPIEAWLLEAMNGDRTLVKLLLAYLNTIVKGRTDLQRFLECVGPGGTGKSSYMWLAESLVGRKNTLTTELKHLEQNRFETAAVYGKRLVLITDSERYGGNVTVLKAMTGQDSLRYERKGVQQGSSFLSQALVIIAANEAIQSADQTSGLERRKLTVPFLHQVAPDKRRDLQTEFKPYLAGLLNWVLSLPDEEVTSLVRNTATSVPSLNQWKAETLLTTNPLAEWLDSCVVHDSSAKTYVGVAHREKDPKISRTYQKTDCWLYANYCEHTTAAGNRAVSSRRFSDMLLDLCRNQLKLAEVSRGRDEMGSHFSGLVIRNDIQHSGWSRPITGGFGDNSCPPDRGPTPPQSPDSNSNPDGSCSNPDGSLMAGTPEADGFDGSDGSVPIAQYKKNIGNTNDHITATEEQLAITKEKNVSNYPSDPSGNLAIQQPQDFQPPGYPSGTHQDPSGPIRKAELKVGDHVTITAAGRYQGQTGSVLEHKPGDGVYRVQLDRGGEGWWKPECLRAELTVQKPADDPWDGGY